MGVGGQHHVPSALPPVKRPGTQCIGGWVGPRAGLNRAENLALTGTRSSDRQARSGSLYRLSYPGFYRQAPSQTDIVMFLSSLKFFIKLPSSETPTYISDDKMHARWGSASVC
jgi:hypothetical protein